MKKISISLPKWLNIYVLASIFPTLSVFACWGVFYGLKHNPPGVILTISETVNPFPENRIFPITMNIECVFLAIVIWLRNSITKAYSTEKKVPMTLRMFFMRLCLPIIVSFNKFIAFIFLSFLSHILSMQTAHS